MRKGNWIARFGFYLIVLRVSLLLICSWAAMAQPDQENPLDAAIGAAWRAQNEGRSADAAAGREQAKSLLQRAPAALPQFESWVRQVAQLFGAAGRTAQARDVLQEALARSAPLGNSHPSRVAILSELANLWQQDGNLLKAAACLEQAVAAKTSAPSASVAPSALRGMVFGNRFYFGGYSAETMMMYSRLAFLYQQMGRPDAVAAIAVRMRAVEPQDPWALAQFYDQHGQLEQAAALYQAITEHSPDPQAQSSAWRSLAQVYARQERFQDAVAACRQAIAALQSSSDPDTRNQTTWIQPDLATYLRKAGQIDLADQVYRQLLERQDPSQAPQFVNMYALYLADTERAAEGEKVLKSYLAGTPDLEPAERVNLLFGLASIARRKGDAKTAEEYQQAGEALQWQPPSEPGDVANTVAEAQAALRQNRLEDAYDLALGALAAASQARGGQQVGWLVTQLASALAEKQAPAKAEQLYARLLALAETWSQGSFQPLIMASANYVQFLMGQPAGSAKVPAAIQQYRGVLIEANGADSATLVEPLRMEVEFQRSQSQWENAAAAARRLLELQASLTGDTSEGYLQDLQLAAGVYQGYGDDHRAVPLQRSAVHVADLLSTAPADWRRAQARLDLAYALARLNQFDEAETVAMEASALQRPPYPPVALCLDQIRELKRAAAAAKALAAAH